MTVACALGVDDADVGDVHFVVVDDYVMMMMTVVMIQYACYGDADADADEGDGGDEWQWW